MGNEILPFLRRPPLENDDWPTAFGDPKADFSRPKKKELAPAPDFVHQADYASPDYMRRIFDGVRKARKAHEDKENESERRAYEYESRSQERREPPDSMENNRFFKILGYMDQGQRVVILNKGTQKMLSLFNQDVNNIAWLVHFAPIEWWRMHFPSGNPFDRSKACSVIQTIAQNAGEILIPTK